MWFTEKPAKCGVGGVSREGGVKWWLLQGILCSVVSSLFSIKLWYYDLFLGPPKVVAHKCECTSVGTNSPLPLPENLILWQENNNRIMTYSLMKKRLFNVVLSSHQKPRESIRLLQPCLAVPQLWQNYITEKHLAGVHFQAPPAPVGAPPCWIPAMEGIQWEETGRVRRWR